MLIAAFTGGKVLAVFLMGVCVGVVLVLLANYVSEVED